MNTFNKLTIQIDDTDIVEVMANVNTEHYIICATSIKKLVRKRYVHSRCIETFDRDGPDSSIIIYLRNPLQQWTIEFINENVEERERDRLLFVEILRELQELR
jgi:hypothetical protein